MRSRRGVPDTNIPIKKAEMVSCPASYGRLTFMAKLADSHSRIPPRASSSSNYGGKCDVPLALILIWQLFRIVKSYYMNRARSGHFSTLIFSNGFSSSTGFTNAETLLPGYCDTVGEWPKCHNNNIRAFYSSGTYF